MSKVTGILESISAKQGKNAKTGKPWTAYSIQVDTGSGKTWFRYGFDAPTAKEGSLVSFEAVEDKPGYFKVASDVTVEKAQATQPAVSAAGIRALNDAKQNSIVRQNATLHAAKIVGDMVSNGVIKLPAKGNNYDLYLNYVKEVSEQVFLWNIDPESKEELLAKRGDAEDGTEDSAEYWPDGDE